MNPVSGVTSLTNSGFMNCENLGTNQWRVIDMLTPEQKTAYEKTGIVSFPDAFSATDAGVMVDLIWDVMSEKFNVYRDDPATWSLSMGYGFGELKRHLTFQKVGSEATRRAIDSLLGKDQWVQPSNWGQLLVTFPSQDKHWGVPTEIWHTDFGFLPETDPFGVLVFGFLSDVQQHGGGTVVIEGSHRLVQRFVTSQSSEQLTPMKRVRLALMESNEWLRDLTTSGPRDERMERFTSIETVSGIPLRVVELTGQAGDIVICHPWMLHAVAVNCRETPRMMCIQRIHSKQHVEGT